MKLHGCVSGTIRYNTVRIKEVSVGSSCDANRFFFLFSGLIIIEEESSTAGLLLSRYVYLLYFAVPSTVQYKENRYEVRKIVVYILQ